MPVTGVGLLAGLLAGCAYSYPDSGPPPGQSPVSTWPASKPLPTPEAAIEALEAKNRAEVSRILGPAPEGTILQDSGRISAATVNLTKSTLVPSAGRYTLTAVCVGAPSAQLLVRQSGESWNITFACGTRATRDFQLDAGPVTAGVMRPIEGPLYGTGAIAGLRICPTP